MIVSLQSAMVIWAIFINHFLEVGLTQNWEIMALQTFTTVDFFYFIMCEDPCEQRFIEKSIGLRAQSRMASHYT
jgi:hypothetical protein